MDISVAQSQFEAVLGLTIHDIKNSLVLLLDKLEANGLPPQRQDTESAIFKYEIRRINNNLVRLLSLYRFGAHRYRPQIDRHDVGDFVEEIMLEYQALLKARDIVIETGVERNLLASFDKALMFSVLENALNNASRYCKGKVKITARCRDGFLEFSVLDDGEGYPGVMLDQCRDILEESFIDTASGTTGLGIYFSCIAARLHADGDREGYIALENGGELGGSRFRIGLPLHM